MSDELNNNPNVVGENNETNSLIYNSLNNIICIHIEYLNYIIPIKCMKIYFNEFFSALS